MPRPAAKGTPGAKGAAETEAPRPGRALTLEGLAAMPLRQRRYHLLFSDLLEDWDTATSTFPRQWAELAYGRPDPRLDRHLGVLKAAEARGRVHALRLRYIRMRAEEITLLIRQQGSARAAIRLELFLPPQLKPTRIPDPLDKKERRHVETILEETMDGSIFPR